MSPISKETEGRKYWRSLDELADTAEFREFVAREFPSGATQMLSEPTRRGFLKIMGATLALAGLGITGCRWPRENILPYAYRPEGFMPGEPRYYATAYEMNGSATGLLVQSYDGRPIKVEGNPQHPFSLGSSQAFHQALTLEMYDPDRSQAVINRTSGQEVLRTWDDFDTFAGQHFEQLRVTGGAGLAVLTEASSSPSLADMRTRFQRTFPRSRWYVYEPINDDNERDGARLVFGQPYRTHYDLSRAKVILAVESDLLEQHPASIRHSRQFAEGRRPDVATMNRLYAVEGNFTVTGMAADHRMPLRPSQAESFLLRLAAELGSRGIPVDLPRAVGSAEGVSEEFVAALADDLALNRSASVVAVGRMLSPAAHAAGHAINAALGNVGTTVSYTQDLDAQQPEQLQMIQSLATDAMTGNLSTLLILGGNPVYDAPADVEFTEALARIDSTIHLSLYNNETSQRCTWHLPRAHTFESWGDARAWDGTVSIIQPLISPLYEGRTPIEMLSMLGEDAPLSGYDIVRRTMGVDAGGSQQDDRWATTLASGIVADSAWTAETPSLNTGGFRPSGQPSHAGEGAVELLLTADYSVFDGRFANNGWLQENPDPLSKITWDNALYVGVKTAENLGLATYDMVRLTSGKRSLEVPVYLMPGIPEGAAVLPLGYGRDWGGRVSDGAGFNAYKLLTTVEPGILSGVLVEQTGGAKYQLAITQDHFAIDLVGLKERHRRAGELVREMSLSDFTANPNHAREIAPEPAHLKWWIEPDVSQGHAWAMAIDLNACTGCGACVVACQAENNIPVVGKQAVATNREMHWIRVDRYFSGDPDNPTVMNQPVTCQHCENAPCEQVCPVGATVHGHEGLNEMVYNRCIGTRYCSNNCPYKVRRFNFFNYRKNMQPVEHMGTNPEVTVRSRGVMEKCTFCVQRIQAVKIDAKNNTRPILDDEIVPACAQACPSRAITFGDLNDPNSRVSKLHNDSRTYAMLGELNTQPRLKYMARVRNATSHLLAMHGAAAGHGGGAAHGEAEH
jgi:MoCo/4Fe-4S cofactor protein with predicted Tat translocation signal